jgi:uncharacterized membrane protein
VVIVIFFLTLFLGNTLAKYNGFTIYGYDFAVFDQTTWNSAHGFLFENSVVEDALNLLGQRFPLILLALAPLYALNDQRILVILPPIAVVFAAFPFYWYARERLGGWLALTVCLAYFISPGIQHLGVGQFYETYLALAFLSLATLFLLRRHYRPLLACLVLTLMCKEEMGFVVTMIGLYMLVAQRQRWLGLAVTIGGLAWSIILIEFVIPSFSQQASYYYFSGSWKDGAGHYDYLGTSVLEIIQTALTRPDLVLQHLLIPAKTDVLLQFFGSLGFLPLLGLPVTALALPTLGYTFLSDLEGQYVLNSHHHAPIYPFLVFGMIVGIERILRWQSNRIPSLRWRQWGIGALVLLIAGLNYYRIMPGTISSSLATVFTPPNAHDALGLAILKQIQPDAKVLTQQEILPHLTQRRGIYLAPFIPCFAWADYVIVDQTRPWYGYQTAMWDSILTKPYLATLVEQDGYILKANRPVEKLETALNLQVGDSLQLIGYSLPQKNPMGGQTLQPVLAWYVSPNAGAYVVRLRLVDAQGHVWAETTREPCQGFAAKSPTSKLLNDDWKLRLPLTMPAGKYSILVSFLDSTRENNLLMRDSQGTTFNGDYPLDTLFIAKNKNSFTAGEVWDITERIYIDMGEMRLIGYTLPRQSLKPSETMQMGVFWRAREKPRGDYAVAVQLRDTTGKVVFEQVSRPANDTYATPLWDVGEVLLDWHDFALPANLATGDYQAVIVLRNIADQTSKGEAALTTISVGK